MNTLSYSREYDPPAPVIPVGNALPEVLQGTGKHLALVDSGADGTFVPTHVLEELDVPALYMTNVHSHLGEKTHRVSVYLVDIIMWDTLRLPNIEVVGDDWGDCIILGRNVLNLLRLRMDGPREILTVLE
jgi:predicted aspartyl protease